MVALPFTLTVTHRRYTGFSVWLHNVSGAPLLVGGAENVVAVFLAATAYTYELWGYEGEGIQRDVTLVLYDSPVTIVPWSVVASSELVGDVAAPSGPDGPLSADAVVAPVVDVANGGATESAIALTSHVLDPAGINVGSTRVITTLPAGGWERFSPPPIALTGAQLWSPANSPDAPPRPLYTLVTTVVDSASGEVLDTVNVTFGIRRVVFDPAKGLSVNGCVVQPSAAAVGP